VPTSTNFSGNTITAGHAAYPWQLEYQFAIHTPEQILVRKMRAIEPQIANSPVAGLPLHLTLEHINGLGSKVIIAVGQLPRLNGFLKTQ